MTALAGLKVLDFTGLLPGPFGTRVLADMGAMVLRVEAPTRPDMVRIMPPFDSNGLSSCHASLNRNKSGIAIDLKTAEGIEIVRNLVKEYDIVVEQFRPGVMSRLGIGYEELKVINPKLIYCAITGYGQNGIYKNRAGHDLNYLAIAGIMDYTGRQDAGPLPLPIQAADITGGLYAVNGILAAVIHRMKTGEGQFVDVSLTDAAFSLQALTAPPALVGNDQPKPETDGLNGGSFYDCYRTSDSRFLSIAGLEPQFFSGFCMAIGQPELIPLGISKDPATVHQVKTAIRDIILQKTLAEWNTLFSAMDVCVEPVLTFAEACEHPQIKARNMVVDVPMANGETQRQIGCPVVFSATPVQYILSGGHLGAESDIVLQGQGYSTDQVADLKKRGVIA
ncbi:crotonobetainyl-CoA:carnitine CoA-transferase CaiB-like acyl-CoA transferase [Fluviicoccus keumensis]|uniref:Crotonobetainyl-CoA:carnitine CoA-transferase CaiB-like acyl-CoA transferase n=1 Tax=Fluviicoccus keumensis TaxID=1435465 RepID=A0A4Q7Z4I1_9GAMM|nr:crotonobetainyl-CoA:carnitine CoA-transferase CaiB-like acyl-CoA transferase [Fluviicoccus keumensis]